MNFDQECYLPHTIYVRFMSFKGLNTLPRTHVPHVGFFITALPWQSRCIKKKHAFKVLKSCKQSFAEMVLTPETNVFAVSDGARSRQSTSAAWPWKLCSSCPLSTSHNAHVPSPLDVRIFDTSRQGEEEWFEWYAEVFIPLKPFLSFKNNHKRLCVLSDRTQTWA